LLDEVLEARSYMAAKQAYDSADTKARDNLPKDGIFAHVREITFEQEVSAFKTRRAGKTGRVRES
jgi:hypothetical protein